MSFTSCLVEQIFASQEYLRTSNLANAFGW